ncbi:hypothetical protein C8F04DRAFT_1234777 [Mycena alexandri]|uniref:Nephrocystin 3-like N-terminal domain-containing protein n=1 Tax=Mycena alexandri TaxID=1745969 RepID=A0AAD6X1P4_9AGAR|nr:hypothetical protein C8F04DRAFT_1234777 [Mycena alexandri]
MTIAHRRTHQYVQFHVDSVAITSPVHTAPQTCRAYVRVRIANGNDRLRTSLHLHLTGWQENLPPLALKDTSQVTFDLRYRPVWKSSSSQIAQTEPYPLSELFEMQEEIGSPNMHISIALYAKQNAGDTSVEVGSLRVTVRALSAVETAKLSRDNATISVRTFRKNESMLLATHFARCKAGDAALQPIYGILEIVGPFLALSGEPISSSIIGVVRGVAKIVKAQIAQDAEVMGLLKVIESICRMVRGATVLDVGDSATAVLDTALRELVSTLTDCTDFVVDFCDSSFLGMSPDAFFLATSLTETREGSPKPREGETSSRSSQAAGEDTDAFTPRVVTRDMHKARGMCRGGSVYRSVWTEAEQMLDRLACIEMTTPPKCSDFAFPEILTSIRTWATSPLDDGESILWLQSPAGCDEGAAAQIVTNLFHEFQNARQLGGSVFFSCPSLKPALSDDDVVPAKSRDPSLAIQTLAVQLASGLHHTPLRNDIAWHIKANPGIANGWLEDQFEQLVLQPLLSHAPARPVVFLLDGLDRFGKESGREDKEARGEREALERVLRVLVEGSARFPPNVRLLVSGGQSKGIREILGDCRRVIGLEVPLTAVEFVEAPVSDL